MGRLSIALLVLLAAPAAWGQASAPAAPGKTGTAAKAGKDAPAQAAGKATSKAVSGDTTAKAGRSDDAAAAGASKNDDANAGDGTAADFAGTSGDKSSDTKDHPPSYYYVDPSAPPPQRPSSQPPAPAPAPDELPPPPGYGPDLVYEPPPPPKPHHVAPKRSLWLGARVGWFVPFGGLWGSCTQSVGGQCQLYDSTKWSAYASSGPMFELDGGARLGRNYNLFVMWEHAALGNGSAEPNAHGGQNGGSTDYYAIGARVSSDPDSIGFLTEVSLGYRRFHAVWGDGSELQLTNAPFEFRVGLGADIRISRGLSISPMATVGAGGFGTVRRIGPKGAKEAVDPPADQAAGHAWATLQLGGHFDIAGSSD